MGRIGDVYAPALRRVPGIVVGVLEDGRERVTALGSMQGQAEPDRLCWEIGSITKVFTGLLLAEMSLRGEVGLDDPIGDHLPERVARRLPEPGRQPRLSDLATHTASFPRLPLPLVRRVRRSNDPYSSLTEDDVFACLGPRTARPRRRTRPRYSNFGMGLLGHLLARAAGRPYGDLVAERILTPLGLDSTGIGGCGAGVPTVEGFRKGRPTPPWTFGALAGAGALRSTAGDLLAFCRACIHPPKGPLGAALRLAMTPARGGQGPLGGTGLGWQIRPIPLARRPSETVWHNGGTYGASSFLALDPVREVALVALGTAGPRFVPHLDKPSWAAFDGLA